MIQQNMPLVRRVARRHLRPWLQMDDLVSEGVIGLLLAFEKFDPERGIAFSSYAAWWVRAQIVAFVGRNGRVASMRHGRAARTLGSELGKERRRMEDEGEPITDASLASNMGLVEEDVRAWRNMLEAEVLPLGPAGREAKGPSLEESLADESGDNPEQAALRAETIASVQACLGRFPLRDEREREIWTRRLVAARPMSQRVLGEQIGVSKQRVSQLERRLVARLRDYLLEQFHPSGAMVGA